MSTLRPLTRCGNPGQVSRTSLAELVVIRFPEPRRIRTASALATERALRRCGLTEHTCGCRINTDAKTVLRWVTGETRPNTVAIERDSEFARVWAEEFARALESERRAA